MWWVFLGLLDLLWPTVSKPLCFILFIYFFTNCMQLLVNEIHCSLTIQSFIFQKKRENEELHFLSENFDNYICVWLDLTIRANCQTKKDDLHDFHREGMSSTRHWQANSKLSRELLLAQLFFSCLHISQHNCSRGKSLLLTVSISGLLK